MAEVIVYTKACCYTFRSLNLIPFLNWYILITNPNNKFLYTNQTKLPKIMLNHIKLWRAINDNKRSYSTTGNTVRE